MKSVRKFPVTDPDCKHKIPVEVELKKEEAAANLKKFFHEYNSLFSKPNQSFGDPESYFKYTLRNSKDFNLFKDLHKLSVNSARSSETLPKATPRKLRFQRSVKTARPSDNDFKSESKLALRRKTVKRKLEVEVRPPAPPPPVEAETKVEIFLTPRDISEDNQEESEGTEELDREEIDRQENEIDVQVEDLVEEIKMAEGEEEVDVSAVEDEFGKGEEMDEMEEVEAMIKQASKELEQVAEENQQLLNALAASDEEEDIDTGSYFKFNPKVDRAVLRELEECEQQARQTASIITKIKKRVSELMSKEQMSEEEAKELEAMNKELKAQMVIFEQKTKRIQQLITQANLFDDFKAPVPSLKTPEDKLPKVIVCGATDDKMPKIIICTDKTKKNIKTTGQQQLMMTCTPRAPGQRYPYGAFPPVNLGGPQGFPQQNLNRVCTPNMRGMGQPPFMMPQQQMMPFQQQFMPPQQQQQAIMPPPPQQQSQTQPQPGPSTQQNVVPQLAQSLTASYNMQEKLAAENKSLEGQRFRLQSDLATKDTTVENLQKQLDCLKQEMRMLCRENAMLNEKLQGGGGGGGCDDRPSRNKGGCGCEEDEKDKKVNCEKGNRGTIESKFKQYSETTETLERQLFSMEKDVRCLQKELCNLQKEREHLQQHKKQLCEPPVPHVCAPPSLNTGSQNQQLCELKEKYKGLQDDFKSKLCEVAGLRAENEKTKSCIAKLDEARRKAEEKVTALETEMKKLTGREAGSLPKENLVELEQELKVSRQRFREAQDELEELRALIEDQQTQLDDYRNKYIVAQQEVEEQNRQIDMMEMENSRVSEQVNLEIQRVKNQFQEKLQELAPLPDVLKCTQIKLQEAQQMHLLAERNNEAMATELKLYKDKVVEITKELEMLKGAEDNSGDMVGEIDKLKNKIESLMGELACCKQELGIAKEIADEKEKLAEEKLHEIAQLQAQLESVRDESARQVARTKDRCETVRRSMQNQITELERQLAQCRAATRAAQKDRDDIRLKMQAQINNLIENFEDAQMRIRNLQGHVNFLKVSYNTVLSMDPRDKEEVPPDACLCGLK